MTKATSLLCRFTLQTDFVNCVAVCCIQSTLLIKVNFKHKFAVLFIFIFFIIQSNDSNDRNLTSVCCMKLNILYVEVVTIVN